MVGNNLVEVLLEEQSKHEPLIYELVCGMGLTMVSIMPMERNHTDGAFKGYVESEKYLSNIILKFFK